MGGVPVSAASRHEPIALALGAGGARGLAQIGVIEALQARGLRIVAIAGASSGALVGGLLVGVVQSLMTTLWPQGASLMIYGAMAVVILVRPYGLFGRA